MTNAIVGFQRQTGNFTYSEGDWNADYPVSNATNDEYARVARSNSLLPAATRIRGFSPDVVAIRAAAICAHSCSLSGAFKLTFYDSTNSPSITVWESGIQDVWPAAYTYDGRDWENQNFWSGQYTESEIAGQIPLRPIPLETTVLANEFLLEIFDEDNPNGYIDIGLLEIASGWELSVNPEYGAQYGYRQYTRTTEIDGGLRRHEVFPPSYVFEGSVPFMSRDEVQYQMMELIRQHGIHKPFLWIPEPDNPQSWLRNSKMVTLDDPGLMSYITDGFDSLPLRLLEYKG